MELVVAGTLNEDAAAPARLTAKDARSLGPGTIEEGIDGDLGRGHAEGARAGQSTAPAPGPRGVRAQPVLLDEERVFRLQDLHRRVAAVPVVRAEHTIAIVIDGAAPATSFDVIVRVVIPVLGMKPTEQEIARGRPLRSGDPLRHRPGQRPDDDVLDVR